MKTGSIYLAVCGMALVLAGRAMAQPYTEIVAFGDSLSDMGNNRHYEYYPQMYGLPFDAGKSAFPTDTWVQQLAGAGMFNIPSFKPSNDGGTNYAYAGSTTRAASLAKETYGGDMEKNDLTSQVTAYLASGNVKTGTNAIHTLEIGGNDIMAYCTKQNRLMSLFMDPSEKGADKVYAGLPGHMAKVIESVKGQILELEKAGVKNVLWMNMFDPGATPIMIAMMAKSYPVPGMGEVSLPEKAQQQILRKMKQASDDYNTKMDAVIAELNSRPDSPTKIKIIKMDLKGMLQAVIDNPRAHGFEDVTNWANKFPAPNPPNQYMDKYLYLDGLHPSYHAFNYLAKEAYKLLGGVPNSVAVSAPAP